MKHKILFLSSVIVLVGILMGIIFPAGGGGFSAMTSAISMRGRNLVYYFRKDNGRLRDCLQCSNSVEFVKQWAEAYKSEYKYLSEGECALWNIFISEDGNGKDFDVPTLVSANLDVDDVIGKLKMREYDMPLNIGRRYGSCTSCLNNKAVVVVWWNGRTQVFKRKYCTARNIWGDSITNGLPEGFFITPNSRIEISQ